MSSRNQVLTNNTNSFPNNNSGQITPQVLRDFNADFINSTVFLDQTSSMAVASASYASNATSASFASNANTASFAVTASFALNAGGSTVNTGSLLSDATSSNADITFTRGNGTTFNVNINNVVNADTASSTPNALVNAVGGVGDITFTRGDGSAFAVVVAVSGSVATSSLSLNSEKLGGVLPSGYVTTASFNPFSSSIAGRVSSLEQFSSSLDATFATDAQLNAATASLSASISSLTAATSSYITNSQTSSMSVLSASYAATASSADVFRVRTALTASGLNYPTVDGVYASQVLQTNAAGTLSFGNVEAIYEDINNGEATTLTKGTAVYISGSIGDRPTVYRADASVSSKMPVSFIVAENINAGANGRGVSLGLIRGFNTALPVGTELFVDGNGTLTNTRPTGSSDIVQLIGVVVKTGSGGILNVLNPGPTNLPNLQSGYVWVGNANSFPTAVATSSIQNVISSSYSNFAADIASGLNISASNITVTNNLTVNGTASFGYLQTVSGSAVIIGEQYIVLNADTPTAPFAGIQVYDTGSAQTASLEWNGNGDYWIGVEETGMSYGFLTGVTSSKGNEIFPAVNKLVKGTGYHGLQDSAITDNGSIVSINSNTQVTGSLFVSAGITGSLLGTASFADNATSASYANNAGDAATATSASYAISASQAQNAVSASYAPDTTFPYTGSAGISGSLVLNGDAYFTGSLLIKPTTIASEQPFSITEISDGTGFEGNIIISRGTSVNTTGSIVVSGSNNIFLPTNGASNSHINGGGASGWRGNSSIVTTGNVTVTGSLGTGYARLYPQFSSAVVNNNITVTDNRPVGTTTAPIIFSSVASNATVTTTLTTGSTNVSNTNLIGIITINSTGSNGATRVISNSLLGNSTITNDSNSGTVLTNSIINGTTATLLLSGSSNGTLQSVLVVGNNLTVTGSNTTAANLGSAFVGRFNDLGTTALAANTAFAVGTGTAAGSRRTSLHVSSSGLTTISNGLITGSLLGTASFADTATSASFASTASFYGGSVVSASYALTASYVEGSVTNQIISGSVSASVSPSIPAFETNAPAYATFFGNPDTLNDTYTTRVGYNSLLIGPVANSGSITVSVGSVLKVL